MNSTTKKQTIRTARHGLASLSLQNIEVLESIRDIVDLDTENLQKNVNIVVDAIQVGEQIGKQRTEWFLSVHSSSFASDPDTDEPFLSSKDRTAIINSLYVDLHDLVIQKNA